MDNVPIDCRKVVEPPEGMLTDEQFLVMVRDRLRKLKGAA
jgi:formylmethanofuran dehydrogenase subunit B